MVGRLILVVGPSGVGKDTLIAAAAERYAGDRWYSFPRRLVTRPADANAEDHGTISRMEFDLLRIKGDYTLSWSAHGHGYIIPSSVKDDLALGRTVVINVSRGVIAEALKAYPGTRVILVTATPEVRAKRLAARGRETEDEIVARLNRDGTPLPFTAQVENIDNSGELDAAIERFCAAIEKFAAHKSVEKPA